MQRIRDYEFDEHLDRALKARLQMFHVSNFEKQREPWALLSILDDVGEHQLNPITYWSDVYEDTLRISNIIIEAQVNLTCLEFLSLDMTADLEMVRGAMNGTLEKMQLLMYVKDYLDSIQHFVVKVYQLIVDHHNNHTSTRPLRALDGNVAVPNRMGTAPAI